MSVAIAARPHSIVISGMPVLSCIDETRKNFQKGFGTTVGTAQNGCGSRCRIGQRIPADPVDVFFESSRSERPRINTRQRGCRDESRVELNGWRSRQIASVVDP